MTPGWSGKERKSEWDTYLTIAQDPKRHSTGCQRRGYQPGDEHVGYGDRMYDVGHGQHEEKRTRRKEERKNKLCTGETYSGWIKGVWGHRECRKGKEKEKRITLSSLTTGGKESESDQHTVTRKGRGRRRVPLSTRQLPYITAL
jgi:hypothetical protein